MERQTILTVIEKYLILSVDDLEPGTIDPDKMLSDYGANSLDIVEIVSGAMRELKVRIPRTELSDIKNIGGLADKFEHYSQPVPKTVAQ